MSSTTAKLQRERKAWVDSGFEEDHGTTRDKYMLVEACYATPTLGTCC